MAAGGPDLDDVLERVRRGDLAVGEAKQLLRSYADLGFARIDTDRTRRTGFPEVVFAQGKTPGQVVEIIGKLRATERRVLATRVDGATASAVRSAWPDVDYDETARTLTWIAEDEPRARFEGYAAVVSGGTSDMPVAEEAAVTAEAMGAQTRRIYDVGVAGIHRLFGNIDEIRAATVVVVVAGMEGALGSVVAGLVPCPVVAVPTSVGYGASFSGLAPLLTMLNSCAPGISVVNIDNGFGAGYLAAVICRQVAIASQKDSPDGE